jgi:hypothetical protein
MRTKTLLLTAALVAAGVASSMAQSNVYSLNIVGYVNIPVTANQFITLENPLDDGAGDLINSVFASFNPQAFTFDGSSLFTFNPNSGFTEIDYNAANATNGSWTVPATALPPGAGFFLFPGGSGTVTFVGNVVLNSTNNLVGGFSLAGSAYPASTNLTGLQLPTTINQDGDSLFRYNAVTAAFTEYDFNFGIGWTGGNTNGPTLNVGESFFYFNSTGGSTNAWTQAFTVN